MDECKPLPNTTHSPVRWSICTLAPVSSWMRFTVAQGLTLVHFSAQRQRFVKHRGCVWGLLLNVFEVYLGVSGGV